MEKLLDGQPIRSGLAGTEMMESKADPNLLDLVFSNRMFAQGVRLI